MARRISEVTVRLSTTERKLLERLAELTGDSMSGVIRRLALVEAGKQGVETERAQ